VAFVAEEEDNHNMNMNMNATSTTTTNDNSPSNNPCPMYHDFPSSSPLLVSSSMDFQQHLHQLQQQQQMKHELDQLQKRQQELVQMISTNTTTMTQKYNNPYSPMSMPMSQIQQEKEQEQQQQLQSSTASASATITPPITKKKTVNLGKTHFIIDLTEEADPTHTTVDTNNTAPSELDILLGRGKVVDNHQGNICYRKVVESFRKQYETLTQKGDKTTFIRDVVDIMYENGHQFVQKVEDSNPTGCATTSACTSCAWVPVGRHVARDKVSNSFRNFKRRQIIASASASASANNKR